MRVLAIDPAAEAAVSDTGWAVLEYEPDGTGEPLLVACGYVSGGYVGFTKWELPEYDVLVCEKYVPYNRKADPTPLLVEGVVRYLEPDTVLQRSSALSMVPDKRLKALGWYKTSGHHRDVNSAIKHALYYLRSCGHRGTVLMLS